MAGGRLLHTRIRETAVKAVSTHIGLLLSDGSGHDFVEYMILAGFVAVAAGAFLPSVPDNINIILSRVRSLTAR